MSEKGKIEHSGVVVERDGDRLKVEIVSTSACVSCSAAGLCSAAESKKKIVDATCGIGEDHAVGDEVVIEGSESMGMKAVLLAYAVPLVILVGGLLIGKSSGMSDAAGAMTGLLSLVPYYFILWLNRKRLDKAFKFKTKNQIM